MQLINDLYINILEERGNYSERQKTLAEEDAYNWAWEHAMMSVKGESVFHNVFEKYVFDKIPKPQRIHLNELLEVLFDMSKLDAFNSILGLEPEYAAKYSDGVYTSFVNYVNNHILRYQYSAPFPICAILSGDTISYGSTETNQNESKEQEEQNIVPNKENREGVYEGTLWRSEDGVSLNLVGKGRFESRFALWNELFFIFSHIDKGRFKSRFNNSFSVMAQITGRMSENVCRELSEEFKRILPSIWRFVQMLCKIPDINDDTVLLRFPSNIDESNLPVISEADFESGKFFVQKCIHSYFSTPTKKDTFDRRIRNAVHLLIESDTQSNDAIGLAMSVTAIEALLGENIDGLSQKLADNVSILLEREPTRRHKASEFVKDLYKKRSRILHGDETESGSHFRHQGRQLAAGVLNGMITYQDFLKKSGFDPQTPQDFLKCLFEKRYEPGLPAGLLESNVRELWR